MKKNDNNLPLVAQIVKELKEKVVLYKSLTIVLTIINIILIILLIRG